MSIFYIGIASICIMYLCNSFEQASSFIGKDLGSGSKGILLDGLGSSLPELMCGLAFIFSGKPELLLCGVAVSMGSGVYNACLIPAISIICAKDKNGNRVKSFSLKRKNIIRDGFYLLLAEGSLIWMLSKQDFTIGMSLFLFAIYIVYAVHAMYDSKKSIEVKEEYEFESLNSKSKIKALLTFDFNNLIFKDRPLNWTSSIVIILLSIVGIGFACELLTHNVVEFSSLIGISAFIGATIFASASTSVPDTILAVGSAKNGEFQDSCSTALSSNTFDTTIALSVPLLIYFLVSGTGSLPIIGGVELIMLRWFLMITSIFVVGGLLVAADNINKKLSYILFATYFSFLSYVIYLAM